MSKLVSKLNKLHFDLAQINYLVSLKEGFEKNKPLDNIYLILNEDYENKKEMHFLTFNNEDRNLVLILASKIKGFIPYSYTSAKLSDLGFYLRIY